MKISFTAVAVASLMFVLMGDISVSAAAVTCNPTELSSCMDAIISASPPSKLCCSKIKAQHPCLCVYLRDPNLKKMANSPNARKVATTCGAPYPKC